MLQRTLAATRCAQGRRRRPRPGAPRRRDDHDGDATGSSRRRRHDGIEGPPDGTPFTSGIASWEGVGTGCAPVGPRRPARRGLARRLLPARRTPSTRRPSSCSTVIARRAEPAVQNAFRYLDGSAPRRDGLAHRPRERERLRGGAAAGDQRGPAARAPALPDPDRPRQLRRDQQAHRGSLEAGNAALTEFGERVRAADPRQRHRLPELGRRGRVLPDPAGDDARGGDAALPPARVRDGDPAARRSIDPPVTMSSGLAELRPGDSDGVAAAAGRDGPAHRQGARQEPARRGRRPAHCRRSRLRPSR